jgi:hypothetical protein
LATSLFPCGLFCRVRAGPASFARRVLGNERERQDKSNVTLVHLELNHRLAFAPTARHFIGAVALNEPFNLGLTPVNRDLGISSETVHVVSPRSAASAALME